MNNLHRKSERIIKVLANKFDEDVRLEAKAQILSGYLRQGIAKMFT